MKVAVVGSSGYIAGFLLQRFQREDFIDSILKIDQSHEADIYLDLLHSDNFDYSILNNIDYIVFTAAISEPDKCAENFESCWKINVDGTRYFIQKATGTGCKVLFFSSDAVFGDVPGCIYYTEESETRAETPYGRMKKEIEDEFKFDPNFKAIRLSYVVSAKDRFITYCLNCIRDGETADIFHPFYRNCITAGDVVDVVVWFLLHWDEYEPFVLNAAGKELVSRVRIADELNRHLGYKLNYAISTPDEMFYRNRPKITQMTSLYMREYQILEDKTFTEKIKKELEDVDL